MITRIVMLRLKDAFRNEADIDAITRQTVEVFEQSALIEGFSIGRPSDVHTQREWQLLFSLQFRDQDALEAWRSSGLHRVLFDQFLAPMRLRVRATNWDLGMTKSCGLSNEGVLSVERPTIDS